MEPDKATIVKKTGERASDEEGLLERGTWSGKLDFVLSLIGFSVGLGNVWRFPYLCYKNGGGAFLIPYFICLIVGAIPLVFLEVGIGQFTSQGGISCWGICPIFKGIGVANMVVVQFVNYYYNVIIAWALFYMFNSFTSVLPWSNCNNDWNTEYCASVDDFVAANANNYTSRYFDGQWYNGTVYDGKINGTKLVPAAIEFWERNVLKIHLSDGFGDPAGLNWPMVGCLALAWVIIYFCIWKGVKSTGKVVYFTATFPYILLTILLVRSVTLEGAGVGLEFYLKPNMTSLKESQVWMDAATQTFYSYSIGVGTWCALSSFNKFNHNFWRDCVLFAFVNSGTSIYAGIVIFSVIGFMSVTQNIPVDEVARSGPGLAFVVYPEGIAQMPVAPLWSFMFFFMILLLGIDSEFVQVEGFITAIVDLFPKYLRRGYRKEIFIAIVCFWSFLVGLSMVTYGGMYVFQLFDFYAASGSTLLWLAFFEAIAIGWVYGSRRFLNHFEEMLGRRVRGYWLRTCWTICTPCFTVGIFLFGLIKYKKLEYASFDDNYVYPMGGYIFGWLLSVSSMVMVPIVAAVQFFHADGTLGERLEYLTTSRIVHREKTNAYGLENIASEDMKM
ncbi:sodium- and chloride-dependent taurine transporter-like isoform X2 [Anneissia japonica]|uniref:sodium- and chloride-dependent taurine transporter-like isoform X2 n=1 Tax=Anneissia japonica TaxID=1529436 RepID=UPI0014258593|nr:sodium- and chloride-dependent taurine transporter-like isoform X2 [Anneissia japonica]